MLLRNLMFYAASFLILIFYGCSTDFDAENQTSSSGTTTTTTVYQSIGASTCISCHNSIAATAGMAVSDYLAGKHVIHRTSITAASASSCLSCHDPLGDGTTLEPKIDPLQVPAAGLAAVTCEACHGGGGEHFAVTSTQVPDTTPDYKVCARCHKTLDSEHLKYHPEADDIAGKFEGSPHFNRLTSMDTAPCNACHSDEGARANKDVTFNAPPAWLDGNISTLTTASSRIQCRTCHSAHSLQLLRVTDANGSAEYNTCTTCHQTADAYHGENASQPLLGPSLDRAIYDTHFDDPATVDIEGYNIKTDDPRSCRDCHDVHSADTTINQQWARSGHASHILDLKEAAGTFAAALTTNVNSGTWVGGQWTKYDWKDPSTQPFIPLQVCQRCHTATGAKSYLDAMAGGTVYNPFVPGTNDYSYLTGGQKELLYCWGCHSDNNGGLRNPGGVTLEYEVNGVNPTLTDLGKSNVCVPCHAGQGNFESYGLTGVPTTDMALVSPDDVNPTTTHYYTAAAMIFQKAGPTDVGYEYPVPLSGAQMTFVTPYDDKPWYGHKHVGLNSDAPETGSGPCVACHMDAKNHTLSVVEKDAGGVITAVKSTACIACHSGEHGPGFVVTDTVTEYGLQTAVAAAAFLEGESEGFHEAMDLLVAELLADGVTYLGGYPYFEIASTPSWIDEGTFGAAHNLVVLKHEPGAYAHNSYYAKRLIFDSIDWLDGDTVGADGDNLDGTITIPVGAYIEAAKWFGGTTGTLPEAVSRP